MSSSFRPRVAVSRLLRMVVRLDVEALGGTKVSGGFVTDGA